MSPYLFDCSEDKAAVHEEYLRQLDTPKGHTEPQWDRVFRWVSDNRDSFIGAKLSAVMDGLRKRTKKVVFGDVEISRPRGCGPIEVNSLVVAAEQVGLVVVDDEIYSCAMDPFSAPLMYANSFRGWYHAVYIENLGDDVDWEGPPPLIKC